MKHADKQLVADVVAKVRSGVSVQELAAEYKLNPSTIYRWANHKKYRSKELARSLARNGASTGQAVGGSSLKDQNLYLKRIVSHLAGIPLASIDHAMRLGLLMAADKVANEVVDVITAPKSKDEA